MEVEAVVRRVDGFGKFVVCGRAGTWWVVQRLAVLIEFVRQRFRVLVPDQRRFVLVLGHRASAGIGCGEKSMCSGVVAWGHEPIEFATL